MNEATLMCSIRPHSNVVQFLGYSSNNSKFLLITEFCAGGSLFKLIQNRPLRENEIYKFIKGIASGVSHLHREGIIHRDLAARNILLTGGMDVKVSDFGMSRFAEDSYLDGMKTTSLIGPIRWSPPELLNNRLYSFKSDVWAFGVVIYEIVTRKIPYEELNLEQVAIRVCNGTASLKKLPKEFPQLQKLMDMCLQVNPRIRPDFLQICQTLGV